MKRRHTYLLIFVFIAVGVSVVAIRFFWQPPFPHVIATARIGAGEARWEDEASLVQLLIRSVAQHVPSGPASWHPDEDPRSTQPERVVYRPSDHSAEIALRRDDKLVVICLLERRSDESLDVKMIYPK